MNLNPLKTVLKFKLPDPDGSMSKWRVEYMGNIKVGGIRYLIKRNQHIVSDETRVTDAIDTFKPQSFDIPTDQGTLRIEIGFITLLKLGAIISKDGVIIHKTHKKPFRGAGKLSGLFNNMEKMTTLGPGETYELSEKKKQDIARTKAMGPEILVDIIMGIIMFFVARNFGLMTAALTGSAITISLYVLQKFIKLDLLGGFATFGVIMALISASLAYAFQDDLFIKLRGTLMGGIGMAAFLLDGLILKGDYLGKRMTRYMAGLFKLRPQKCSFAVAGSSFIIMLIDLPLAFLLTTDQWIWYNSFLDGLIAMPIFFACIYLAREKKVKAPI